MKKNMLSRVLTLALAALLALPLFACGKKSDDNSTGSSGAASYQVGICSYADDASLNQIVDNIESRLKAIGQEKGVTFEISYDNCNTDSAVLNQIIANFMADKVDLMIGVATPVAVAMQAATEGTGTLPAPSALRQASPGRSHTAARPSHNPPHPHSL